MAQLKYNVRYEVRKNDLPKIARGLESGADDVIDYVTLSLVAAADPHTPVGETGNLKGNKDIKVGGGKGSVHWLAPYTGFVHNGTRYMPARPFIAGAVQTVWPMFQQAMKALAKGQS